MHESGGFKLTKFLSNSKQAFQSVDEADRRQGVKDKDLMGDLPAEKPLGVLWNTETGKFGFKVTKLMDKKRSTISYQLSLRSLAISHSFPS